MNSINIAIKEMNISMGDLHRVDKEIIVMATYRHPRIITLYGISLREIYNRLSYSLIMELMEMDLEKYIYTQSIPKTLNQKIKILQQILEGLTFLHSQDVIHCDIKPKNVLLDSNLNVKLTDLGLSKMMDNQNKAESTTLAFTTRYAAKSVVIEEKFSFNSDIWAFGLLMYELLKECKPFQKLNQIQILLSLQQNKSPFAENWTDNLQKELADIIIECVNYDEAQIPTALYCLEKIQNLKFEN